MVVVQPFAVFKNGLEHFQVIRIRVQSTIHVLGLDRDDAAVVAGRTYFRGRTIGDRREGVEVASVVRTETSGATGIDCRCSIVKAISRPRTIEELAYWLKLHHSDQV